MSPRPPKSAKQKRASRTIDQEVRAGKKGMQSKEWDRWSRPAPNKSRLPLGAHPWNTGGKKGRSGRKPDAFKEMCRQLAGSDMVWASVQVILQNPHHPAFVGALRWAAENGYGKPVQRLDVKGSMQSPGKLTKDEMKDELAKLFNMKDGGN